ncbi:FtsX-like permease family protein, partial [Streptomyces sp. NPDC004726]
AEAGVTLPEGTARLVLDVTVRGADGGPYGPSGPAARQRGMEGVSVTATVEDRYGVPYRIGLGTVRADGKPHAVTADLAKAADAPVGRPAGPLALTAVEFDEWGYPDRIASKRFTIGGMRAVGADGVSRAVAVPPGLAWRAKATASVEPVPGDRREALPAATAGRTSARTPLDVSYHTGRAMLENSWTEDRTVTVRAAVQRTAAPAPAALATPRFLESSAAKVGSVIEVPMPGGAMKVRIAGVLRALPTTGPGSGDAGADGKPALDGGALLLDLRAVNRVLADRPGAQFAPSEWWLFTEPGQAGRVASALRERAEIDPEQVRVRDEIARELHGDPLGAGPQSALLAVAAVAALLAAVGFAVAAVGALRERSAEFAVLRALGTPRRQAARLLAAEQSLLIGLALLIGTGLGTVLTRAVVPLIVLTGQATRPVPGVLVELPVGRVALLLAAVAAAPVLVVAVLSLRRGGDPATALRAQRGE